MSGTLLEPYFGLIMCADFLSRKPFRNNVQDFLESCCLPNRITGLQRPAPGAAALSLCCQDPEHMGLH